MYGVSPGCAGIECLSCAIVAIVSGANNSLFSLKGLTQGTEANYDRRIRENNLHFPHHLSLT